MHHAHTYSYQCLVCRKGSYQRHSCFSAEVSILHSHTEASLRHTW